MGDLFGSVNAEQFGNYRGGYQNNDYSNDETALDGEDNFFVGGIKDEEKSSYTVSHVSDGTFEGGYYISATPGGAAKKAATAIFRHIDMETGVRPPSKSEKRIHVPINTALAKIYNKRNPISEISFVILRIDRNDLRKYFAYDAVRERLKDKTVEYTDAKGNIKTIDINFKITVTKGKLDEELVKENKKFQKVKAAKVRAVKDKEEGKKPARKPRAPKGEAKPKKAASAKKAASGKKAAPKKSNKKGAPTLADIVKALSSSPTEVKPKKSAKKPAAKKPAAKKPAAKKSAAKKSAKKSTTGGGFCSFF
jgi:hypothetical protein